MSTRDDAPLRSSAHEPQATQAAIAREPAPFPVRSDDASQESGFADWRRRLARNLSRRSDGRWDPLTRIQPAERADDELEQR